MRNQLKEPLIGNNQGNDQYEVDSNDNRYYPNIDDNMNQYNAYSDDEYSAVNGTQMATRQNQNPNTGGNRDKFNQQRRDMRMSERSKTPDAGKRGILVEPVVKIQIPNLEDEKIEFRKLGIM